MRPFVIISINAGNEIFSSNKVWVTFHVSCKHRTNKKQ